MGILKRIPLLTMTACVVIYATVTSCDQQNNYNIEHVDSKIVAIDSSINQNPTIVNFIKPYKDKIQAEMDSVLAFSPKLYTKKDSKYNTAIGNMMADAVLEMTNPVFEKRTGYPYDAVLLNFGGIRSGINQGAITTRVAYELMPFENEVVVVELSGKQVIAMFDYLKNGTAHPISGMSITLDSNGNLKDKKINNKSINPGDTYFIATSDYLMNGGDAMDFFLNPISILPLDYKIRNVLIDYFKKHDTIAPVVDQRFTKE